METLKRISSNLFTRVLLIALIMSFLLFSIGTVKTTYDSYIDIKNDVERNKVEKLNIISQIEEWNTEVSNLEDPEKLELILRERGYGKDGEILYIYDIPEPVTPINEVLSNERSETIFDYVVEFIVGSKGG
tara:strand:+ start:82 stop:474 length:393 start_codon:yes stop_codon:yes gene_type:complete